MNTALWLMLFRGGAVTTIAPDKTSIFYTSIIAKPQYISKAARPQYASLVARPNYTAKDNQ